MSSVVPETKEIVRACGFYSTNSIAKCEFVGSVNEKRDILAFGPKIGAAYKSVSEALKHPDVLIMTFPPAKLYEQRRRWCKLTPAGIKLLSRKQLEKLHSLLRSMICYSSDTATQNVWLDITEHSRDSDRDILEEDEEDDIRVYNFSSALYEERFVLKNV
jgi:hypothetical protein